MTPNPTKEHPMITIANPIRSTIRVSPLLQLALLIDAVATCAVGLGTTLFPAELAQATHLPAWLLLSAGIFMIAYALVAALLSRRETLPRWAVWGVIGGNALWALECIALALGGILSPSSLGVGFLLSQALVVIVFAELQYMGLKRSTRAV
jgi:hypothetical protein